MDDLLNLSKAMCFGNRRTLDRKILSLFEYTQFELALYEDTAYKTGCEILSYCPCLLYFPASLSICISALNNLLFPGRTLVKFILAGFHGVFQSIPVSFKLW